VLADIAAIDIQKAADLLLCCLREMLLDVFSGHNPSFLAFQFDIGVPFSTGFGSFASFRTYLGMKKTTISKTETVASISDSIDFLDPHAHRGL
jgi:hypothetical protein